MSFLKSLTNLSLNYSLLYTTTTTNTTTNTTTTTAIKQQEHENKIAAQELAIRTALENDKKSTNESSKDGQNGKNNNNEGQKSEQIIETNNNNMSDDHITTIGTNEWKDAAVTMFHLLDLDHDGYISKSELMRATTFMEHKNGGISEALNKLPVLRKQLTPVRLF